MPKKVLIIEDDQTISNMYQAGLSQNDYEITLADNGEKGLSLAQEINPDIILLDIIMPKMDGFAVLEHLKKGESTKDIPVIMLTNLGQDDDRQRGKEMGAVDYVVKADFTPLQISEKIKKYLK